MLRFFFEQVAGRDQGEDQAADVRLNGSPLRLALSFPELARRVSLMGTWRMGESELGDHSRFFCVAAGRPVPEQVSTNYHEHPAQRQNPRPISSKYHRPIRRPSARGSPETSRSPMSAERRQLSL